MNKDEWKNLRFKSNTANYINGKIESNKYSKEELDEKRKYFESQTPNDKFGISRERWTYEIERQFEQKKDFEKYPDASLSRLEFILKYGL